MIPNFLIVGAEKAGTTSLAAILSRHPDVFMSDPKEIRFFSNHNWHKGLTWYESFFTKATSNAAIGEASPAYTWAPQSKEVPIRIYRCLGDIKYIYILRNPIERTISHLRHAIFHRWIPDHASLIQAVRKVPGILFCSKYNYQYMQYASTTEPAQWHIVLLEDMLLNPSSQLNSLYRFLGINCDHDASFQKRNVSDEKIRMPKVFQEYFRSRSNLRTGPVSKLVYRLGLMFGETIPKPELSLGELSYLINELRSDIYELSSNWNYDYATRWGL